VKQLKRFTFGQPKKRERTFRGKKIGFHFKKEKTKEQTKMYVSSQIEAHLKQ